MSDGENALKLPVNHIDFNLNLKIILSPLFDAQKSIYTKMSVLETFHFLFSFLPYDISVRRKIQGDKKIEIMS